MNKPNINLLSAAAMGLTFPPSVQQPPPKRELTIHDLEAIEKAKAKRARKAAKRNKHL
jgi:hypothetical protein